jgi:hypothetical protein
MIKAYIERDDYTPHFAKSNLAKLKVLRKKYIFCVKNTHKIWSYQKNVVSLRQIYTKRAFTAWALGIFRTLKNHNTIWEKQKK